MKTPEEMAEEYCSTTGWLEDDYVWRETEAGFLAGYKAAQQWISVKDRLPETRVPVLVCNSYGLIFTTRYFNFEQWGYHMITHWMELPEAPKEEK